MNLKIPSPKLLRPLLPGIKGHFYPGTQDLTADFGEIPLPKERSGEGNIVLLCVLCELPPSPKASVESLRETAFNAFTENAGCLGGQAFDQKSCKSC